MVDKTELPQKPDVRLGALRQPDIEELGHELGAQERDLQICADPIFLLNRDGSIDDANSAAGEVFGFSPQSLIARDFCERIISPICQESFRLSFERLVTTESGPLAGKRIELSAICSNRSEIPIELTLKSVIVENRIQYVAFVRDISEARKTETLMRESEARFRRIFDSNMTPVYFWDVHGNITDANDAFLKLFGYTRKDLASRTLTWRTLIPSGYEPIERHNLEQLLRTGICSTYEIEGIHKDGRLIPLVGTSAMIEGSRERGVGIMVNLSETRESTRSLKDSLWMFRELLDGFEGFAFVKDTEARFQYVNSALAKHFRSTPDELLGKVSRDVGEYTNPERNIVADKRVLLTGEPNTIEFPLVIEGVEHFFQLRRSPLRDSKGQIVGILGSGHDITAEFKRERELQEYKSASHRISEEIVEGIVVQDPDGKVKFSNAIVRQMFHPKDEWLTIERAPFPPELRPDRLVLQGAKDAEALVIIRNNRAKHSGQERWILQRSMALRNTSGEVSGVISIYRDLTEVRKLEDLNQQQSAAMRASMDALAIHDARGEFVFINDAHTALYGYTQRELQGKTWEFLYSDAEIQRIEKDILPKFEALGSWRGECLGRKKDGSQFFQEISLTSTSAGGIVCAIRDLSDQKRLQSAKRILDSVSRQLDSNFDRRAQARSLAKLLTDEAADFCRIDLLGPEGNPICVASALKDPADGPVLARSEALQCVTQVLQTGKPVFIRESDDCLNIREELGLEAHSAIIAPISARGHALGALILVRTTPLLFDLHDLGMAEEIARRISITVENSTLYERTQQALTSRDDFIAMVSHDLKNPLSAILLNTSFLIRTIEKYSAASERETQVCSQLRNLARSAQRMNKLLTDSLDLARIESGRLILDRQEFKISTLVQEVIEDLLPMAAAKGQHLDHQIQLSRPTGYFDRGRLEQVLIALLTNAIRYTPEHGSILISVRESPALGFLFSVSDSGPGIPPDEATMIFDRYRDLKSQRVCQGVGLPLSRGIVEAHGGKLGSIPKADPARPFHSRFRFTTLSECVSASDANGAQHLMALELSDANGTWIDHRIHHVGQVSDMIETQIVAELVRDDGRVLRNRAFDHGTRGAFTRHRGPGIGRSHGKMIPGARVDDNEILRVFERQPDLIQLIHFGNTLR